jgi:NAD(P)H-hydrate epimerase
MRRPRAKFSHKGNYGHALLIAGSYGKFGAAVLASKACLKAGVGLLTTHIPKTANDILQISTPEAMLSLDENDLCFSKVPNLDSYNAIGIGPGLGVYKEAANAFKILIQETKVPILIDADGLNILAENKTWLSFLPENSILTPHPKEFERLVGKWDNSFEMIEKQKEFSSKHKVICVLKGAYTSVSYPGGELFFNSSGNPSMATAGSGDVLSGIILSLMAQNYHTGLAALYGVFIHGLSADLLMEKESMESLIASDIVDNLGKAFNYKIQLKGAK